jgi:glutamine---fructose-6-phosphate transaminase (isomerizing)
MNIRQEILNIPEALRETLEKGRPEFEAVVRQTRWSQRPIFMIGSGSSYLGALTGALAFESLLGLPVVARRALDFRAYSAAAVERRSIFLALSQSGESVQTIEAVHSARRQGAVVLALTGKSASALAKLADGVFLVRTGEEQESGTRTAVCQQAALGAISVLVARILKRPDPLVEAIEEELRELPARIEWVLTQFQEAARSLASGLKPVKDLRVVGPGFYYPTARHWALLLEKLCKMRAACFQPDEFGGCSRGAREGDSAVVLLSSSRCKLKEEVHKLARERRKAGVQVFAITDSADRELSDQSSMAVLLPTLSEMPGSALALALLDWVAYEINKQRQISNRVDIS